MKTTAIAQFSFANLTKFAATFISNQYKTSKAKTLKICLLSDEKIYLYV